MLSRPPLLLHPTNPPHPTPPHTPFKIFSSNCLLHPLLSLSLFFAVQMSGLGNKGEELYIVLEKEGKLRAVSDNWACLKRRANNRRRHGRRVSRRARWQSLSVVDELFRAKLFHTNSVVITSWHSARMCVPNSARTDRIQLTGGTHSCTFIFFILANNAYNYCGK